MKIQLNIALHPQYKVGREAFWRVNNLNLTPAKADTVSFKAMKKSQFGETDRFIVEKFKAPIEKFNNVEDLHNWANEKTDIIRKKNFKGRTREADLQRKYIIKEWIDYLTFENTAYKPAMNFLIISAITSKLKKNSDNLPPTLDKGVLAATVSELEEKTKTTPKASLNFLKLYQNKLRAYYMEDTDTGEVETKWVVIPSKKNDPENFESNVEKLKALSHKNWCTKSFNAKPYLEEGDFHIYLESGKPKIGIRHEGNEVVEIQGEKNDGKISTQYFNEFKKHSKEKDLKFSEEIQNVIKNAQRTEQEIERIKKDLGEAYNLETLDDVKKVFEYFGVGTTTNQDNTLSIEKYARVNHYHTFSDLGFEENKFFQYISKINQSAVFAGSKITSLGILEEIGEDAIFGNSEITCLGNLWKIGGNADFDDSLIKNTGNLKIIGGNARFKNSKIVSLSNLRVIGGSANFNGSQIIHLGDLRVIGEDADFRVSRITNPGNLRKIGWRIWLEKSKLTKESLKKIKIGEIEKVKKDLSKTLGKACKLETVDDVKKALTFFGFYATTNPDGTLSINRYFRRSENYAFSDVGIDENCFFKHISKINYSADFAGTEVKDLGVLKEIGCGANFKNSQITNLGNLKKIGGKTELGNIKLTEEDLKRIKIERMI